MIQNRDASTWTPDEVEEFALFQENVCITLRTLLACCAVRNISHSDEINSAVDVILLGWLLSSFSMKQTTDIDYAADLAYRYDVMQKERDGTAAEDLVSELRQQVTSDQSSEDLKKMSNTIDFTYSGWQKDQRGHSWRDQMSGAVLDVMSSSIRSGVTPAEVEASMLFFILSEKKFKPVLFAEFVVSRFRSRINAYKEAIQELEMRMSSYDWNGNG